MTTNTPDFIVYGVTPHDTQRESCQDVKVVQQLGPVDESVKSQLGGRPRISPDPRSSIFLIRSDQLIRAQRELRTKPLP